MSSDTLNWQTRKCAEDTGYTHSAISIMLRGIVKNSLGVRYAEL